MVGWINKNAQMEFLSILSLADSLV